MAKILRIINRLNLGGPTYNVANLTKFLEHSHETLLLSGMKDEDEESSEFITDELGLKPMYIKEMYRELNPFKDYKSYKIIKKIIDEYKPDIVHTHAAKAGAIGRLAAINAKVPIVVHTFHGHVFHSYFNPVKTKAFLEIERYLAKKTDAIVTLSQIQKDELINHFKIAKDEKFNIIPLGFDLTRFATNNLEKRKKFFAENNINENEVTIGIIGRLVPIKNHHFFLKIISNILPITSKKIRVFIFGDGELKNELYEYCKELNLKFDTTETNTQQTIKFYSWIKEADIAVSAMDILCLTSKNEGTPVALIEAQAGGTPFVTTDVGGIKDIVANGKTGFVVPNYDETAFTSALLKMIEDDILRNEMRHAGREFAIKKFSHLRLAADMDVLYKKLMLQKGLI